MQDLKTGLFLADNDQTRRVLPQTSADIVEILSSAGEASNVQAEISSLRTAKLSTPAVGGSAGQVLSLDESGNTVWKADEKGDTLPSVSSATAGQVLKVNSAVNGTEWGDVPKELPEQLGTSGQVLAVNSAASGVEWKTPESGLPAIGSASAGDLLAVNSTADGVEFVKPTFYTKKVTKTFVPEKWETTTDTKRYYIIINISTIRTLESDEIISVEVFSDNYSKGILSAHTSIQNNQSMCLTVFVDNSKPTENLSFDFVFLIKR